MKIKLTTFLRLFSKKVIIVPTDIQYFFTLLDLDAQLKA